MTYWIIIGIFISLADGGSFDMTKSAMVRMEVFNSNEACQVEADKIKNNLDDLIKDGKLAGYTVACKSVDVADPSPPPAIMILGPTITKKHTENK
jgi:hypothetical protein